EAARLGQHRRDHHQAPGSDYRIDDQIRAAQPKTVERLAAAPHRRRFGHIGAGDQPPAEAVPGHVRDDEENEEARAEGADATWDGRPDAQRSSTLVLCW